MKFILLINGDEEMLNRAYVFSVNAHGTRVLTLRTIRLFRGSMDDELRLGIIAAGQG